MKRILLLLLMAAPLFVYGQNGLVIGKTTEVPFATISLLQLPDSAMVGMAISDTAGNFKLEKLAYGGYILKASFVGFETYHSAPFILSVDGSSQYFTIHLQRTSQTLNEVVVTGTGKLIESISPCPPVSCSS